MQMHFWLFKVILNIDTSNHSVMIEKDNNTRA